VCSSVCRQADPTAEAFAAEFAKRPKLARIWSRFLERASRTGARQGAQPAAQEFIRELRAEPDFDELFDRWAGRPAFRALVEELLREPGLAEAVRAEGVAGTQAPSSSRGETPAAGQRVFGIFTAEPDGGIAEGGQTPGRRAPGDQEPEELIGPAQTHRRNSDVRVEAHWVDDPSDTSFLSVCRRMGRLGECREALAQCRGDAACARMVSTNPMFRRPGAGFEGGGASSGTHRGRPPGGSITPGGEGERR
jgi:hypothetical protein